MADIIDKNENAIPDVLEPLEDFKPGDILTAETMNQLIAAVKGTYDILTRAPELKYTDRDGFREGDIKPWNVGEEMKIFFEFTSSVYGPVTITVIQTDLETYATKTKTFQKDQGLIDISFGPAPQSYGHYSYEVTAFDANGRAAEPIYFEQIAGGFTFSTNFETIANDFYFISNETITLPIRYNFKYVGLVKDIVKILDCYVEGDSSSLCTFPITNNTGTIDVPLKTIKDGINTLTFKASVYDVANASYPLETRELQHSVYFSTQADNIVILPENIMLENLNTDSILRVPFKVQWFKTWEHLSLYAVGELIDVSTGTSVTSHTSRQPVSINNGILYYDISGFPYAGANNKTYQIRLCVEGVGANATAPTYISYLTDEFTVVPGTGITFTVKRDEDTILLANFEAKTNSNTSINPHEWEATAAGLYQNQWKIQLQSLSCTNPIGTQTWDDVGSGWKQEGDSKYLHLMHNAYGTLVDEADNPIDLSGYLKNGCSLEAYIKADYLSNVMGYNLACLNEQQTYGFVMTPTKAGVLVDQTIDDINAQIQNISTLIDQEWVHLVFSVSPEGTGPVTDTTNLSDLENATPENGFANLFINGVVVKMNEPHLGTLNSLVNCFLYLNNNQNKLNSGYESNSKIQVLRLYNTALTASEIRDNYRSCLTATEQTRYDARNSLINPAIPKVVFTALDNSPNSFDNTDGKGGWAINTFQPADKSEREEDNFPGATKVPVLCSVEYSHNGATQILPYVQVSVQGTSSLSYPIKNYKIKVYQDANFKNKDETYTPLAKSDDWLGDSAYTLKCDYMEHSHKNNTPTASFYNDCLLPTILGINTEDELVNAENLSLYGSPAQQYGYRDAIDGFPITLYYKDRGSNSPVRYVGTYMFNIDKSGLDQGFKIPLSKLNQTFNIPEVDGKYTLKIPYGTNKTFDYTTKNIPCISYEGGTNNNYSAATFVSFEDYKQQQEIMSTIYDTDYDSKEEYYEATLEPRFDSFSEDKISVEPDLLYDPLDRAIKWLDTVWPTHLQTDEDFHRKDLLEGGLTELITNISKWVKTDNKSTIKTVNTTQLQLQGTKAGATFKYILQQTADAIHTLYLKISCANTPTNWRVRIVDTDSGRELLNKSLESTVQEYNCEAIQSTNLQLEFISNTANQPLVLTECIFTQTGPTLLDQSLSTIDVNKVKADFSKYFSYEYCLAYYLQALVFTQSDNIGKNAMFDSWCIPDENGNGQWTPLYPRPYDMDSQMGLNNQGEDKVLTSAEVTVLLSPNPLEKQTKTRHRRFVNQYAVTFSKLWLLFAYVYKSEIRQKYLDLRSTVYDIDYIKSIIEPFTTDVIGECYYNCDAAAKYLFTTGGSEQWQMLSGNRRHRYYSFLEQRLAFLDTYFESSTAKTDHLIRFRLLTSQASITPKVTIPCYLSYSVDDMNTGVADFTDIYYCDANTTPSISLKATGNNKNAYIYRTQHVTALNGINNLSLEQLQLTGCEQYQELVLEGQTSLSTLNLGTQDYLKKLTLNSCSGLTNLTMPNKTNLLTDLTMQNMNIKGTLTLTDTGLVNLNITDTPYSGLEIRNSPVQVITMGADNQIASIILDNCYQLGTFSDGETLDDGSFVQNLTRLQSITIQNMPKLTSISLPKCKASSITISNCDQLTSLTLTESNALTVLDLTTLPNLTTLNLQGCENLTTIYLPRDCNITTFNLEGCSNLTTLGPTGTSTGIFDFSPCETVNTLQLYNTKASQIKNLTYNGPGYHSSTGHGMCHSMSSLRVIKDTIITFTGSSAAYCFYGCSVLGKVQGSETKEEILGITFTENTNITSLSNAFHGSPQIGYKLLYELAVACRTAYIFSSYWYCALSNANNYDTAPGDWPTAVGEYGFFAIPNKDEATKTTKPYIKRTIPENDNYSAIGISLLFYQNKSLCGALPSNFFKNLPDPISGTTKVNNGSLTALFTNSRLSSIDIWSILSDTLATTARSMCYGCTDLTSIGDKPASWSTNFALTYADAMFYKCDSLTSDAQVLDLLLYLPSLNTAKVMFYHTGISSLVREDTNYYPLFIHNTQLTRIDGMFADCSNLASIPTQLFTTSTDTRTTHPNLAGIQALFAKYTSGTGYRAARIKIENFPDTFFNGINPTKFKNLGRGGVTADDWGVGFSTLYPSGGAFCYAEIDATSIENLISSIQGHVTDLQWAFADTIGFKTCSGVLHDCTALTSAYGIFARSSIQSFTSPLFPESNNNITTLGQLFLESKLRTLQNINLNDCTKVTNFFETFKSCYWLEGNVNGFVLPSTTTTTEGMFEACVRFGALPSGTPPAKDDSVIAIPKALFTNAIALTTTAYMFSRCVALYGKIEEDLFINNTKLQTVGHMFKNCHCLRGNVPSIFTNETTQYTDLLNIDYLYAGCSYLTDPFKAYQEGDPHTPLAPDGWLDKCPNITSAKGTFSRTGNPATFFIRNYSDTEKTATFGAQGSTLALSQLPNTIVTTETYANCRATAAYQQLAVMGKWISDTIINVTGASQRILDVNMNMFNQQTALTNIGECFSGLGRINVIGSLSSLAANSMSTLTNAIGCFCNTELTGFTATSASSLPFYNSEVVNGRLKFFCLFANINSSASLFGGLTGAMVSEFLSKFNLNPYSSFFYKVQSTPDSEAYITPTDEAKTSYTYLDANNKNQTVKHNQFHFANNSNSGSYLYQYCYDTLTDITTILNQDPSTVLA